MFAGLRSTKESIESDLYETQQAKVQLEKRREKLEVENQQLILKRENLQSEMNPSCSSASQIFCPDFVTSNL